jgi:hypothetical protein
MAKQDTRSLYQLLNAIGRTMGDPDAVPEDLDGLAHSIRRRSSQLAKDLEAVAEGRRNGHRAVKRAS